MNLYMEDADGKLTLIAAVDTLDAEGIAEALDNVADALLDAEPEVQGDLFEVMEEGNLTPEGQELFDEVVAEIEADETVVAYDLTATEDEDGVTVEGDVYTEVFEDEACPVCGEAHEEGVTLTDEEVDEIVADEVIDALEEALEGLHLLPAGRAFALAITKIEEALFWTKEGADVA